MSIPLLNLDDRKFTDLVEELRALIPRYAPGWTDHNISDPGIMLIELFAWLTEALLYRVNRVPEASLVRLLELLGATFQAAQPALLKVQISAEGLSNSYRLPQGTQIEAKRQPGDTGLLFETLAAVEFTPAQPSQTVLVRQAVVRKKVQLTSGSGTAYQLVELPERFIALPPVPFPRKPQVWVTPKGKQAERWEYKDNLAASKYDDRHFTVRPWLNAIAFGNGDITKPSQTHGRIPPKDATLIASYRYAGDGAVIVQKETLGISNGSPAQTFQLAQPFFALDLQPSSDLTPQLLVNDEPWEQRASFLEMDAEQPEYTLEPRRNAIRFGDKAHGQIPPAGATIKLTYYQTQGAAGNLPLGALFSIKPPSDSPEGLLLKVADEFEQVAKGNDPTSLEEARDQAYQILQPRWRAITSDDIVATVEQNHPEISRTYCLPGNDLSSADGSTGNQPGHIGVIVVPKPSAQWSAPSAELTNILGYSPDGQRLVARNAEGLVRLWDLMRGEKLNVLGVAIRAIAFDNAGKRLATAGDDQVVRIWDIAKGKVTERLRHPAPVNSLAFHPKGNAIATACADQIVRIWDINTSAVTQFLRHPTPVNGVAFRPNGTAVATACGDNHVRIWELNADSITLLYKHSAPVNAVVYSADGRFLASASNDGTAILWDAKQATPLTILDHKEPLSAVLAVALNPDGQQLATACSDGTVHLWDRPTATERGIFRHAKSVTALLFSPLQDRQSLVTASADRTVAIWDVRQNKQIASIVHEAAVPAIALSPDGRQLAIGSADNIVRLWDITSLAKPSRVATFTDTLAALAFSLDSRRLATVTKDQVSWLWDLATGAQVAKLSALAPVNKAVFSTDSQLLATAGPNRLAASQKNNAVQVWDAQQGKPLALFVHRTPNEPEPPSVEEMIFRPDGQQLATVARHYVWLWDVAPSKAKAELPHAKPVTTAAFSADSRRMVTVSEGKVARVWDTSTGEQLFETPKSIAVRIANPSLDGVWLTVVDDKNNRTTWDIAAGKEVPNVEEAAGDGGQWQVQSSAEQSIRDTQGKQEATVVDGMTVYVKNVETGEEIALLPQEAPVKSLVFSPDGQRLATINQDNCVRLWSTQPAQAKFLLTHLTPVKDVRFGPDNTRLVTICGEESTPPASQARLWSTRTDKQMAPLSGDQPVSHATFSPDGQWLATAHTDQKVRCWRPKDGKQTDFVLNFEVEKAEAKIAGLAFSPSSQRLTAFSLSVPAQCTIKQWDLRLQPAQKPNEYLAHDIDTVLCKQAGRWLMLVGKRLLRIWDLEDGEEISVLYNDFATKLVAVTQETACPPSTTDRSHVVYLPIVAVTQETTCPPSITDQEGAESHKLLLAGSSSDSTAAPQLLLVRGKFCLFSTHSENTPPTCTVQVWNAEHVYDVDTFLDGRHLVTSQQHVMGPRYADVEIKPQVVRSTTTKSEDRLRRDVNEALLDFFHPLHGGPDGKSWPPGRAVYRSEIYQVIEGVEGVDHVELLTFSPADTQERVEIPAHHLVNCTVTPQVIA